jgi:prepilin-type N-terminal cleavage/methylation domain-containing protein
MRRGFTLIEVLVVLAVIAVLVSVLLPALAAARRAGQGAGCQSNLRQLGIALEGYAGEWRGWYAPAAPGIATSNRVRWFGSRASGSGAFSARGGPLSPFLGEDGSGAGVTGVRRCGAMVSGEGGGSGGGFEREAGGYGYNASYVGTRRSLREGVLVAGPGADQSGARQEMFAAPAETIGFADAALAVGGAGAGAAGVIEYSFVEPDAWPESLGSSVGGGGAVPDPSMHFRHGLAASALGSGGGQSQSVMLDGHVRAFRRGATATASIYGTNPSAAGLGWAVLGPQGINGWFDYR